MSAETQATLDGNLYGDTRPVTEGGHGLPWHERTGDLTIVTDDDSTNYYPNAIPLTRVKEFLAHGEVDEFPFAYIMPGTDPSGIDDYPVRDLSRKVIVTRETGKVQNIVGTDSYVSHSFRELFVEHLAGIVSESPADLHYSGVGFLRDMARAYVVISTGNLVSTPQGIDYYPLLTVAASVDGSLAITHGMGSILSVCDNTLGAAMGEAEMNGTQSKVRQTKNSDIRLTKVGINLGLEQQTDTMNAALASLCAQDCTDKQFAALVAELLPIADDASKMTVTKKTAARETLFGLWNGDARVTPWKGTAFGALQAVNVADLWHRGLKGDTKADERNMDEFISGVLGKRENSRASVLAKVLANV